MKAKDKRYDCFSRSEILACFIEALIDAGMTGSELGVALAEIWLALPEEIE